MADFELSLEGLEALLAKLGADIAPQLQATAMVLGQSLARTLGDAPGPSNSPVIWASPKQRAFYFAMRRKAGLPAQYTRTSDAMSQKYEQGWAVRADGDTDAIVGNAAMGYAKYVGSVTYQTEQHRATGWKTDKTAVQELRDSGVVEEQVAALGKRLTGG